MKEKKTEPWVADGEQWVDYEDTLIGNREGLRRLRDSIDEAIREGHSLIPGDQTWWLGVRVVDVRPDDPPEPGSPMSRNLRFMSYVVFPILTFAVFALAIKGCQDLFR